MNEAALAGQLRREHRVADARHGLARIVQRVGHADARRDGVEVYAFGTAGAVSAGSSV